MSEQQRQDWRRALATQGRLSRGGRGIRYRQRRTGLGRLDGPGRVRVRVVLPDAGDGQGDDTNHPAVVDGQGDDTNHPAVVDGQGDDTEKGTSS